MKLFEEKQFQLHIWRKIINTVCDNITDEDTRYDAICPFGFELLQDVSFLSKNLRRFYCYIGIPEAEFSVNYAVEIETKFVEKITSTLHEVDPIMAQEIVMTKTRAGLEKYRPPDYQCAYRDKMLFVKARATQNDILSDYCNYVISVLGGFINKNHPQIKEFGYDQTARNHVYQLYIMLECIFDNIMPEMNQRELEMYRSLFSLDNNIQIIFDDIGSIPPKNDEMIALNELIFLRTELMGKIVNQQSQESSKLVQLSCLAYHGNELMEITIAEDMYSHVFEKIYSAYINYGVVPQLP